MRRRRLRGDKGTARASYRATKRHARLRAEPKLRGLRRQPSDEAERPVAELAPAPAAVLAVPPIEVQVSPLRPTKRRRTVAASEASE